jgi:glyceraldehyde-3-phosphate dehydrogenase (NADP+)
VFSPIRRQANADGTEPEPIKIGKAPLQTEAEALAAVQAASKAWDRGMGAWPQAPVRARIEAVENFAKELQKNREEIVNIIMWEICKPYDAACQEVDRTVTCTQCA